MLELLDRIFGYDHEHFELDKELMDLGQSPAKCHVEDRDEALAKALQILTLVDGQSLVQVAWQYLIYRAKVLGESSAA